MASGAQCIGRAWLDRIQDADVLSAIDLGKFCRQLNLRRLLALQTSVDMGHTHCKRGCGWWLALLSVEESLAAQASAIQQYMRRLTPASQM